MCRLQEIGIMLKNRNYAVAFQRALDGHSHALKSKI